MATFGEILLRAAKLPYGAGIDPVLLKGYVNDRHHTIINHYPWSRIRQIDTILQTVAVYQTGTIAFTAGLNTLTGTGTTWTAGMTGRRIRNVVDNEYYTFTYVSTTTGTIDRLYEGETAALASYKIWQPIYALPTDIDVLESIKIFAQNVDIDQTDQESLDKLDASRLLIGNPACWAPWEEDASATTLPQIELYPGPDTAVGLPIRYTARVDAYTATSTIYPTWISIECLFAGVEADVCALAKDYNGAQLKEAKFQQLLVEMLRKETNREAPVRLRMNDRWTNHRRARSGDGRGDWKMFDRKF